MMASKQVKIVCAGLVLACALLTPFTWSHRASPKGYEKSSSDLEVAVGISPSELSKKRAIDSILVRAGGNASALIHKEVSSKPEDGEDEEGSQTGCNRARITFIVPKGFKYPADTEGRFEPTDHKLDGELIYLIMKTGEDGNKVTLNCNNENMEEDLSMEASPDGYEGQCEFVCSASDDGVHQWNLLQNNCICAKKIVEHDASHLANADGDIHRGHTLDTAVGKVSANNESSSSEDEDEDEDEKTETNANSSSQDGSEDLDLAELNKDRVISNAGEHTDSVSEDEDREPVKVNATTNDVADSSVEDNQSDGWPKAPSLPEDDDGKTQNNGEVDEEDEDEEEEEDENDS